MVPPVDGDLLAEAVALARQAGELTLRYFRNADLGVDRKADGTPVTDADRGAERLLRAEIAKRWPGDGIIGEEEGPKPTDTGRTWVLDPIDGTKAFTHGVPLYTNLVALEDESGTAVGVINMPALGETVAAGRGLGCFCNESRVAVNNRADLAGSYLTTSGLSPDSGWTDATVERVRNSGMKLRTWGDGYGYALVATGRLEAMVDPLVAHYDIAPMPVILAEAGGRFTDWTGNETATGGSGLATNGVLHEQIRALLTTAGEE